MLKRRDKSQGLSLRLHSNVLWFDYSEEEQERDREGGWGGWSRSVWWRRRRSHGEKEEEEEPPVGSEASASLAVRGDVRGAAAVAVGGLGSLDVQVQELHLEK